MRALVLSGSLDAGARMGLAACGLAMRGHEVLWAGSPASRDDVARLCAGHVPDGLRVVSAGPALARARADLVLAGGAWPPGPALAAMVVGAHGLLLDARAADLARWGAGSRWAWGTLRALALVPEEDAEPLRADAHGIDLERVATWSAEAMPEHADAAHADVEVLERACERTVARGRGRAIRAAVFVDRDGTLVVERGYLSDPGDLELLPGVPEALRRLRAAGYAIVVISNQAGVGRGRFPLARVYDTMAHLRGMLRDQGAEPDAIWFCPHAPEAGCACRKPGIALLQRAAEDLQLALPHSVMVGDKLLDAETGRNAGGRGVLVRTGYGRDEERRLSETGVGAPPDHVCDGLPEAADWILAHADPDA